MAITFHHVLGPMKGPNEAAILKRIKDPKHFAKLKAKNTEIVRKKLQQRDDIQLIIQAQGSIEEATKGAATFAKRLREWYELYAPEISKNIQNHEKFAELVATKSKSQLLREIKCTESIGTDLSKEDLEPIKAWAQNITNLYKTKEHQEKYLEKKLKEQCPNLQAVASTPLAAQLLAHTNSLKKLALFPASTIQVLGAEQALFRHLKTKAKPPKHGLIIQHPLLQNAKRKHKGKIARMLADKIAIAVKVDFFKGKFVGNDLITQLEKKVKSLK